MSKETKELVGIAFFCFTYLLINGPRSKMLPLNQRATELLQN